jgi:hypothetical protein
LATNVLAAALWLLSVGSRGRKVIILIEFGPVLFLLYLAGTATSGTSSGYEYGAGGSPGTLVAIDKTTAIALGFGLGLGGARANAGGFPKATSDDGGGTLGIGARQRSGREIGVGEVVKGDHGRVEGRGSEVAGEGGQRVESVRGARAAAAVAGNVEVLFRGRSTTGGAIALWRGCQGRRGDGLRIKLRNLGGDVQRVEGEVAGAWSETKAHHISV